MNLILSSSLLQQQLLVAGRVFAVHFELHYDHKVSLSSKAAVGTFQQALAIASALEDLRNVQILRGKGLRYHIKQHMPSVDPAARPAAFLS